MADSDVVVGRDGRARPAWAATDPLVQTYYDTEWGMPVTDERGLFERLSLEAFQAGLSWGLILHRRDHLRRTFHDFDPDSVAAMGANEVDAALAEPRIIRNRRKIESVISNAHATIALRPDGGLAPLIWSFTPATTPAPCSMDQVASHSEESRALARALKRRGFTFVGPTLVYALMEAIGMVDDHLVGSWRRGSSGIFDPDGHRRPGVP